ncbi:MAG: methylcrotonoyl-CoA carboxylase [Gammaproteobacteria bacterium]|nr:methylcrotonoyl-CoA carboxylase [Gammaproteobacteria bacterium]
MDIIQSRVSTQTEEYKQNFTHYETLIDELHTYRKQASIGGSEKARTLHRKRNQLMPRERIAAVLDPGSPWLEIGQLAGLKLHKGVPPGALMVTGIGLVRNRPCMFICNDPTVKGGTLYGMTCNKQMRAQEIAEQYHLPTITMVQSGGAFLPDIAGIFPDKRIMTNIIRQSAKGIPQIASVHGPSTAGGAYIPALCDENIIVKNQGAMFLGGPQLTFAATGEQVDVETLGGAEMHCSVSGVADHLAENDLHAMALIRSAVSNLPSPKPLRWDVEEPREPLYDPKEIYGLINRDPKFPTDNREILARLVDGSEIHEFKKLYGDTLITAMARIKGYKVGILINNGVLYTESSNKATHFIDMCSKWDIPLLFIADINGFMVGTDVERQGIAKAGANMINAMANAKVPRITLIIGGSYGAGYLAMCGRPFDPELLLMWPTARCALMGTEQAVTTLTQVQEGIHEREGSSWTDEEKSAFQAPIRKTFDDFANAYNWAANQWCDAIIDPLETRDTIAMALELSGRKPTEETTFGIFRM